MSEFQIYLRLGFEHITDWNGYDHILFVMALCAIYLWSDWRKVLGLITAFTVGHSFTLALAIFGLVPFSAQLIEQLIPVTIIVTAMSNWAVKPVQNTFNKPKKNVFAIVFRYAMGLGFGLIHGLGFSNYLRSLLLPNEDIILKLLAFNIGLELGQLLIVLAVMVCSGVAVQMLRVNARTWNLVVSSWVAGMAFVLLLGKLSAQ